MGAFLFAAGGLSMLTLGVLFATRDLQASGPENNRVLNYQARLTDNNGIPLPDGAKNVKFVVYDAATSGNCEYTARGTCGTPTAKSVTVANGHFSTLIGGSGDVALPINLFSSTESRFLEILIETSTPGTYETLTPRKQIASGSYAMNANLLDDLDTDNDGGSNAFVPVTDASGNLVLTKDLSVSTFTIPGSAAPSVSTAGQGRIYFDSTSNTFKSSANGGAYSNLGYSGWTDDGTAVRLTTATDSVGIGSSTKLSRLTVTPSADQSNIGGTTTANISTTITGSGTSFLTALGIGDRISLSSATSTYATVIAIASDTSLTVDTALGNGTSQTINKKSSIFRLDDAAGIQRVLVDDLGRITASSSSTQQMFVYGWNTPQGTTTDGGEIRLGKHATIYGLLRQTSSGFTELENVWSSGGIRLQIGGLTLFHVNRNSMSVEVQNGASFFSPVIIGDTTPFGSLTLRSTNHTSATTDAIIFQVGNNGATEAMRIVHSGNVGIGSSTKLSRLTATPPADQTNIGGTTTASASTTIVGSGTAFLSALGIGDRISLSSAATTYATVTAIASDTSLTVDTALGNGSSQTINKKSSIFRLDDASNVTKFVVNDQGYVGVGTVAPGTLLTVKGGSATDNGLIADFQGFCASYDVNTSLAVGFGARLTSWCRSGYFEMALSPNIGVLPTLHLISSSTASVQQVTASHLIFPSTRSVVPLSVSTAAINPVGFLDVRSAGVFTPSNALASASGSTVTNTSTLTYLFTSGLIGSTITIGGQARVITAVTDSATATVSSAFSPAVASTTFTITPPIASFWSVGSNRMMIDDTGNVGIGDTSPAALLTVGNGDLFQVNSSGDLVKIDNVTYNWPSSQGAASTSLVNDGSGNLSWSASGPASGGGWTDDGTVVRLTTATDNVGIGTTTPAASTSSRKVLEVEDGTNDATLRVQGSSSVAAELTALGAGGYVGTPTNHPFNIFTNNSTRMTIDTSGNVGIGTTSPLARTHISNAGETLLNLTNSSASSNADWGVTIGSGGQHAQGYFVIGPGTGSPLVANKVLTLVAGGEVIIGNATASTLTIAAATLDIQASSAGAVDLLRFTGNTQGNLVPTSGNANTFKFGHNFSPTSGTATYAGAIITQTINQTGGANGITRGLFVNPSLTAVADYRAVEMSNNSSSSYGIYQSGANTKNYFAGKVGIGTTGPVAQLHVVAPTSIPALYLANSNGDLYLGPDSNGHAYVSTFTAGKDLYFQTDATERFRVTAGSGSLTSPFGGIGRFENYLTYSEQFDNAAWTKTGGNAVTGGSINSTVAPDGQTSADTIDNTAGGATDNINQSASGAPATASTSWVASIWMKVASGTATISLRIDSGNETGTAASKDLSTTWQRFTVSQSFTSGSTGTANLKIINGTSDIIVWGAQLEKQSSHGVYAATGAAGVDVGVSRSGMATGTVRASGGFISVASNVITVLSADGSGSYLEAQGANNLRFYTNSAERVRIDNAGNVGIGTTGPSELLHIEKSADVPTVVFIKNPSTGSSASSNLKVSVGTGGDQREGHFGVYDKDHGTYPGYTVVETDTTSSPGIALRAATGTGIISFITGGTGAVGGANERLRIAASGNVGVGMTAPVARLDLAGNLRTTGKATAVLTGSIDPVASTTVTGVGTLFTTQLVVGDRITVTGETRTVTAIASDTSLTVISAFSDNANDTSPDALYALHVARDSSNAVKFVIDDIGRVGIGTTAPDERLDVRGTSNLMGNGARSAAWGDTTALGALTYTGSTPIVTAVAGDIGFSTDNNVTRIMTLKGTSNNVGIGTTGPAVKLEVNSAGTTSVTGIRINTDGSPTSGAGGALELGSSVNAATSFAIAKISSSLVSGGSGTETGDLTFFTRNSGTMAEKMRILANGNVGIGTTSPGEILHIASSVPALVIQDNDSAQGNAQAGYISFRDSNNVETGAVGDGSIGNTDVYLSNSYGGLRLRTGTGGTPNDRIFIDTSGNVGIGTTTPFTRLDVAGNVRTTGKATAELTGDIDPIVSTTVTGVGTLFLTELVVGDRVLVSGETRTVTAIAGNTSLTVDSAFSDNANDTSPDAVYALHTARDSSNALKMVINDIGKVGIGTAAPFSLLANTSTNLIDAGAIGLSGNSIGWETSLQGYVLGLSNLDAAVTGRNGLLVKIAATDTLSYVAKFESDGVNRLAIRADGNVGIGDTSPDQMLDVEGGIFAQGDKFQVGAVTMGQATNGQMRLDLARDISFATSSPSMSWNAYYDGGNFKFSRNDTAFNFYKTGNNLEFYASPSGTAGNNVTFTKFMEFVPGATSGSQLPSVKIGPASVTGFSSLNLGGNLGQRGRATAVLTGSIDPAASTTVTGSGTTFTTELLIGDRITVTGETRTVTAIANNTSLTVDTAFSDNANDTSPDVFYALQTVKDSANSPVYVMSDLGNVGIGITNPGTKLDVVVSGTVDAVTDANMRLAKVGSTGDNNFLSIQAGATNSTGTAGVTFGDADDGDRGSLKYINGGAGNTDVMTFHVAGERMRIDSSGFVGIGETSPTYKLSIRGTANDGVSGSIVALNPTDGTSAGAIMDVSSGTSNSASGFMGAFSSSYTSISTLADRLALATNSDASGIVIGAMNSGQDIRFYTNSTTSERMRIEADGDIGMGTGGPATQLHLLYSTTSGPNGLTIENDGATTSDLNMLRIISEVGGSNEVKARIDSDGDLFLDGAITASSATISVGSADFAEEYSVIDDADIGHVVSTAGGETVKKSSGAYDLNILGVISTKPGLTLSMRDENGAPATYNPKPIALVGRVPVKVSMENGSVAIGDFLTSSSTAGVAMKATEPGVTIGRALEAAAQDGTVLTFVNTGWYNGEVTTLVANPLNATQLTADLNVNGKLLLNVRGIIGLAWSISEDGLLTSKEVEADKITTKEVMVRKTDDVKTIGQGIILATTTSVTVTNPSVKSGMEIFITFRKNPRGGYWVDAVNDGSFTVMTENPVSEDAPFSYWLIGIEDATTPAPPVVVAPPEPEAQPEPEPEPLPDLQNNETPNEINP